MLKPVKAEILRSWPLGSPVVHEVGVDGVCSIDVYKEALGVRYEGRELRYRWARVHCVEFVEE